MKHTTRSNTLLYILHSCESILIMLNLKCSGKGMSKAILTLDIIKKRRTSCICRKNVMKKTTILYCRMRCQNEYGFCCHRQPGYNFKHFIFSRTSYELKQSPDFGINNKKENIMKLFFLFELRSKWLSGDLNC